MSRIRDVWAINLEQEMRNIRETIEKYPYVAMDTEFPGVVARPIGTFRSSSDYHYQTMRCNVDLLKIIQIGITLSDEEGHYPEDTCTWQFNFHFSINEDMYAPESIELLHKSGIDFQRHEEMGIMPRDFAELLITSGLVLFDDAKWISFHSGYDFGYLVKLLTCVTLPTSEEEFFDVLSTWFPTVYDVKFMMRACKALKGGLQEVADDLGVMRIGPSHQAGSDSLLTAATFFKMRELYFNDRIDDLEYNGKLYGLGQTVPASLANGVLALDDPSISHGLRSGATIAERAPDTSQITRDTQVRSQQTAQTQNQGAIGSGALQTPGLAGYPTPYGGMPGAPYIRPPIGVGGADR